MTDPDDLLEPQSDYLEVLEKVLDIVGDEIEEGDEESYV